MFALLRSLKVPTGLFADRHRRGGSYQEPPVNADLERHLHEAVEWLLRAQDAGINRGVSYGVDLGGEFLESYPETTGYIVPTILKLADCHRDESLLQRVVKMGRWESEIQLDCGAVTGDN